MPHKNGYPLLPIVEDDGKGELISETYILPTIEAMWNQEVAGKPWFMDYSYETKQMMKWVFFCGISEAMRTLAFRINSDQDTRIFDELEKEILAYDRTLQAVAHAYQSVSNGHSN